MTARRKPRPVAPAPDPKWTDALETAKLGYRFCLHRQASAPKPFTVAEFAACWDGIDITLDDALRIWRQKGSSNGIRNHWICQAVRMVRRLHPGVNSCAVVAEAFGMEKSTVEKVWRERPAYFSRP